MKRIISKNGIAPSDMNTILSGVAPGTITKDGMEPIHQRHYNQGKDFKQLEYKYNYELDDVLDKLRYELDYDDNNIEVDITHSEDDYDLYNIYIHYDPFSYIDTTEDNDVLCEDIEDVDDLMVCLEQKSKNNTFASSILRTLKSILDGRI